MPREAEAVTVVQREQHARAGANTRAGRAQVLLLITQQITPLLLACCVICWRGFEIQANIKKIILVTVTFVLMKSSLFQVTPISHSVII